MNSDYITFNNIIKHIIGNRGKNCNFLSDYSITAMTKSNTIWFLKRALSATVANKTNNACKCHYWIEFIKKFFWLSSYGQRQENRRSFLISNSLPVWWFGGRRNWIQNGVHLRQTGKIKVFASISLKLWWIYRTMWIFKGMKP